MSCKADYMQSSKNDGNFVDLYADKSPSRDNRQNIDNNSKKMLPG